MKTKIKIAGLVLAFFMLTLPLSGQTYPTTAGTSLFSTNTTLVFSNWANVYYTNFGTNNWGEIVQAIYGFTNTFGSNYQGTYTNYPSQEFFALYELLNKGNTNTTYSLKFIVKEITNYDGKSPTNADGNWTMATTNTNSGTLMFGPGATLQHNATAIRNEEITPGSNVAFAVYLKSPRDAINGTGYRIYISNAIATNDGPYKGSNNTIYGGTNMLGQMYEYVIKAPDMNVWKTISVTNPSHAVNNQGPNALVPGSKVTYTIHYTNKGDADALGLQFKEYLPNLTSGGGTRYVDLIKDSFSGTGETGGAFVFDNMIDVSTNSGGLYNQTLGAVTANKGTVNTNIDAFRLNFTSDKLAAKKGGTIEYSVIVR